MSVDQVTTVKKSSLPNFTRTKDYENTAATNSSTSSNESSKNLRSIIIDAYQARFMSDTRVNLNIPDLSFLKIDASSIGSIEELSELIKKFGIELNDATPNIYGNRAEEKASTAIYNHILNYANSIENSPSATSGADKLATSSASGSAQQTVAYMLLILLPLAKAMAESNFMLADEQLAINDSIGRILQSSAQSAENYTDEVIEETKKAQKKLDDLLHKFSGFIGIAIGALEIGMAVYTGLKSIATENVAGAAAAATIFVDGALRLSAGTLVIMDTYTSCFGGDVANNKTMQNMCLYGMLYFMGDDAAKMQAAIMVTIMAVGCVSELSALADTIYGLANMAATITAEVVQQLTLMLISAASTTIGLVFAFKAMVESFTEEKQKEGLDPEQVTAMFGGRMGLLALIIDKSGLKDLLTNALAKELSKDNAEMVEMTLETGVYIGLSMGNMYGNSLNQKNLSNIISESEVISMTNKLQGKLPQAVLVKADAVLNKIHQMVTKSSSVMSQAEVIAAFSVMSTYAASDAMAGSTNSVGMALVNKTLQDAAINQQEKTKILEVLNSHNQAWASSLQDLSKNLSEAITNNLSIQKQMFDNLNNLALQG